MDRVIDPMECTPRRRRPWSRLLLLAIASLASLVSLEILVRILMPQPVSWLAIYRRHPRLPILSLQPDAKAKVATGETDWTVITDADGNRVGQTPPANTRPTVLWLGDSFAFGHGVDHEQCWIGLLQADPGTGHNHRITAVPGHGPTQYRQLLEDELQRGLKPSSVIAVTFLGNDFHDTIWDKDLTVNNGVGGDDGGVGAWMKRTLHSYRLASRVYHRLTDDLQAEAAADELSSPEAWRSGHLAEATRRYKREFETMAALCKSRDLDFAVVIVPSETIVTLVKTMGRPKGTDVPDARIALARATTILEELGLRTVDVTDALAANVPREMFFRYDGHLTPAGHRVVRNKLAEQLPLIR